MELTDALAVAAERHQGVLVTIGREGRPQLSNIVYGLSDGVARISVTDGRAKVKNLARDPRASLYVPGESFWSYLVLDGTAALSPVAADPQDAVVDELVDMYRTISGEHPDWDDYRRVMVDDQRRVVRFTAERAYGISG